MAADDDFTISPVAAPGSGAALLRRYTRVLELDIKEYLRLLVAPTASGLAMLLLVVAAKALLPADLTGLSLLVVLVLIAATVYPLVLYLTDRRFLLSVLSNGRRFLSRADHR